MVYVIQTAFEQQQDQDGTLWSSILILLLLESCLQTCTTYAIAERTMNDSWWWTEELSERCRVSFQNKFEKLVHLVGFIISDKRRYVCVINLKCVKSEAVTVGNNKRNFCFDVVLHIEQKPLQIYKTWRTLYGLHITMTRFTRNFM
jgi:hypothetical protein